MPVEVDFDVVLAQSVDQFKKAKPISDRLQIPLIRLEHTLPYVGLSPDMVKRIGQLRGQMLVTVSGYNRDAWGWPKDTSIIHHGIDTDFWTPDPNAEKKKHAISVVNDFVNRSWCTGYNIWEEVTREVPFHIVGSTPGLSEPANPNQLLQFYREAGIFLNTTLVSSAPVSPLEAMACGLAVVSTATTTMPDVIEHGVNGFLSNDPKELIDYCKMLLDDPELAREMGQEARRTVVERFSIPRFVAEWNAVFEKAANLTFLG